MRQVIIVRKDLEMSPGKLSAQVSHASMAFLTTLLQQSEKIKDGSCYHIDVELDADIYESWIGGIFTKTVCSARNRYQLEKCKDIAEELGLQENRDFFCIKDACLTELAPEEYDETGQGRTLTCIGFRPLPDEIAQKISRRYQLYR